MPRRSLRHLVTRVVVLTTVLAALGWTALSVAVERESGYRIETLGGRGPERALVLYHPSRDAHFSDDLSHSVAVGLMADGLRVDRATTTSATPPGVSEYVVVAVVANTYYWTPDLPTLRYLDRVRWNGAHVFGIVGGAGSTTRAEHRLGEALRHTGATVLEMHSFWLWRPNGGVRMSEPNRAGAIAQARAFAERMGNAAVQRIAERDTTDLVARR